MKLSKENDWLIVLIFAGFMIGFLILANSDCGKVEPPIEEKCMQYQEGANTRWIIFPKGITIKPGETLEVPVDIKIEVVRESTDQMWEED